MPKPRAESITALSADVKTLCSQYERLSILPSGILCRSWPGANGQTIWQKVVPSHMRTAVASELHKGMNGGHLGTKRARYQIQRRFYWPGWAKDVQIAMLRCEQCSKYKRPQNKRQGLLQPMVVGEPWERIGVDITGPHPVSSKGNVYILTMIDHFTKWIEIFPMRNQEAATVARLLVDRVFAFMACPCKF